MSDIELAELSYSDRLLEAFRGIKSAAVEHGVGDEVGEAIAHFEVVARNPPGAANAPSSQWMEAVARAAVERTGAVMSRRIPPKVVDLIVEHALKTPPPAGPGGPNERPA